MPIEPPDPHGKLLDALRVAQEQLRALADASASDPLVKMALASVETAMIGAQAIAARDRPTGA